MCTPPPEQHLCSFSSVGSDGHWGGHVKPRLEALSSLLGESMHSWALSTMPCNALKGGFFPVAFGGAKHMGSCPWGQVFLGL